MNKKIIFLNVFYYTVLFILINFGKKDPSSSLGYGFMIMWFWIVSMLVLMFILSKKIIVLKSIKDKIGIITATPILSIAFIVLMLSFGENATSESYSTKNGITFKTLMFRYKDKQNVKRLEFYRGVEKHSSGTIKTVWLKDSTWLFFSENGDTIKKVQFELGKEIKEIEFE